MYIMPAGDDNGNITPCWKNFYEQQIHPRIDYNVEMGKVYQFINDYLTEHRAKHIVPKEGKCYLLFDSEEDAVAFVLRWS